MGKEKDPVKVYDVEQLLAQGNAIRIFPRGSSMCPMFRPDKDEAVISPLEVMNRSPKRGDVVLYRRENSILVLHRIFKVAPEGVYFVGDNQVEVEGPLSPRQIRGILTSFVRNGREISVYHPLYVLYSRIWLFFRPFRHKIVHFRHFIDQTRNNVL